MSNYNEYTPLNPELTEEAEMFLKNEKAEQEALPISQRDMLKVLCYEGLVYLSRKKDCKEIYEDFKERIENYKPASDWSKNAMIEFINFRESDPIKEIKSKLVQLKRESANGGKYHLVEKIDKALENLFYHEYCQGAFFKFRQAKRQAYFDGRVDAENKKDEESKDSSDDTKLPF